MRLLDRIATLVKADAHGVLESMEDRRLLAKQHVREAELALESKRAAVAELSAEQHRLSLEAKRLAELAARIDEDVALAMDGGDDALARAAIRKLLPLREAERRIAARRTNLHEEEARIAARLSVQEQEFEVLNARVAAELALAADSVPAGEAFRSPVVMDDDVELELLRRRQGAAAGGAGAGKEEG